VHRTVVMKRMISLTLLALGLGGCAVSTRPAAVQPHYRTVAECPAGYAYDGYVCRDAHNRAYRPSPYYYRR
jgi:hypothetical protein